jgi:CDP-glucose 4,6-dehydratase
MCLDAIRALPDPCVGVMITTDKVYENPERGNAFTEDDKLGGYDPYSASKAAAEIVIESYRRSFFNPGHFDRHGKAIASVRAGNVIGGR